MRWNVVLLIFFVLLASGCTPTCYLPPKIDRQTGYYTTETALGPGDMQKFNPNVDLGKFSFVYLETSTRYWPARFEFFVRAALVRMGFSHVLNEQAISPEWLVETGGIIEDAKARGWITSSAR